MNSNSPDRIQKQIVLKASRQRVWQALTDTKEFGEWFRVALPSKFSQGARATGNVLHPGYEHLKFDVTVERMEPERVFAWRWVPNAVDANRDYSKEPTTLVVFELEDAPGGGTLLKVTESGFDQVPPDRREKAYRGNEEGWGIQLTNVQKYVGG